MEIKKTDLQKALGIVTPGLASNDSIEQTTSFAFINGKVFTYNDEIAVSHPVKGLGITGAIQAKELYALLGKLKSEVIKIEVKESEIVLKSGRAKAGLILQAEIKLPIDGEIAEKGKWGDLPKNFNKQLLFAIGACGTDMSSPLMTCAFIKKEGLIEGSDRYKIARCSLDKKMPVADFLLPASSASKLVKLNPIKAASGNGWVHFKTEEGTVISCRIFEDSYPDIGKHLKVKGSDLTLPEDVLAVLDKAQVFAKRDQALNEIVHVKLEGTKLEISSESEGGWFRETLKVKKAEKDLDFKIPPYLLKDILKQTSKCVVGKEKLKFAGKDWEYIAALK